MQSTVGEVAALVVGIGLTLVGAAIGPLAALWGHGDIFVDFLSALVAFCGIAVILSATRQHEQQP